MIKLIISCLNVSFKKLIVWLQLYPKLIASDYITTGRPLGRTKAVHSCVTPQGAWSRGSEAWLADPSGLTYFNRNGQVRGLGKSSWYAHTWFYQTMECCYPVTFCKNISTRHAVTCLMKYNMRFMLWFQFKRDVLVDCLYKILWHKQGCNSWRVISELGNKMSSCTPTPRKRKQCIFHNTQFTCNQISTCHHHSSRHICHICDKIA